MYCIGKGRIVLKKKLVVILFALSVLSTFLFASCSPKPSIVPTEASSTATEPTQQAVVQSFPIRMEPLSSEEYDRLMNFGAHTPEDEDADKYLWRYHCEAPPKFIDVWLEIYEKGQLVEKCETMDTNIQSTTGLIFLLSCGKEDPHWEIGLKNGGKYGDHKGSYRFVKAVQSPNSFQLYGEREATLIALFYSKEEQLPQVSFSDLQKGSDFLQEVDLCVLFKAMVMPET